MVDHRNFHFFSTVEKPRVENPFNLLDKDETIMNNLQIFERNTNINTDLLSLTVLTIIFAFIGIKVT